VHPSCRVKLKLTVGGKNIAATNGKAQKEIVIISDADHEEGMDEAEEDSSDDGYGSSSQEGRVPMRRTRRTAALPFSPRKTRLRRVNVIDESDESSLEGRPAQRRSKRIKPAKVAGGFDSSSSFSSYRDDRKTQSNLRPKKARVKKSVKPAYGHIHNISDVEYESDDEFACLSRHRNVCGKCHEGPAHDLLKKYNRRNGKSIRKKAKDGLDDTEDEAESLNSLGGWVRWSVAVLEYLYLLSLQFQSEMPCRCTLEVSV
jgi:chromodomain-helicase-DNA-binding protein 4